ncbi:HI0074 family nucleotidyltransferase substrate-binding subunit [Paramagnetospirillum kuznetsovii]|uniref:HI0074 family nucleotidyltransferase substrate-binding subunit n=1 Tax=Paramagnetospirillum kuznetsovii TaxID=2053833 RepID=UPI00137523C8|nr:HI0074 family nucleotidyltransferase substrate-binding subunit [Paramagnetospirillum kuznetsovii]
MDRLDQKLEVAGRACATLIELVSRPYGDAVVTRDATILRFVYSFETTWKAAQRVLNLYESIDVATPRAVIQSCWKAGLLNDEQAEQIMAMITDRNLTVHAYDEKLAVELATRIPAHAALLGFWLTALRNRVGREQKP